MCHNINIPTTFYISNICTYYTYNNNIIYNIMEIGGYIYVINCQSTIPPVC